MLKSHIKVDPFTIESLFFSIFKQIISEILCANVLESLIIGITFS